MRTVQVAAVQCSFFEEREKNIPRLEAFVREAAGQGAEIVLLPELIDSHYFCKIEEARHFALAHELEGHPTIEHFKSLAQELKICLPVSFFEKAGPHYHNSLALLNAEGVVEGLYRKSHIPDGPGYEEKFYFRPGDTGFKIWRNSNCSFGVGICWDQWFPEAARCMMLMGAEILFYPTAIGSEPQDASLNTKDLWQKAMIGHSVSNVVPVIAANRIGREGDQSFYGHSFIASHRGEILAEIPAGEEGVILASLDLDQIQEDRAEFGFFRDRRPDLYSLITKC